MLQCTDVAGVSFSLQYNLVSQEKKLYKKSIFLNLNTNTIWPLFVVKIYV